ncbi:MAG: DNA-packaging protein [Verrucomicrobiota bacterium]
MAELSPAEQVALAARLWDYENKTLREARPDQLEPSGDWWLWLILSGRGWGKTRTGAEWIRKLINSGAKYIHLVGRTAADVRDTMVRGESGLEAVCQFDVGNVPVYEPSKRLITWPCGAKALLFSAEEPDALRGPQCEYYWADELASWKYMQDAWNNLQFGARLGQNVRGVVTTTPRPVKLIKELIKDPGVHSTRGKTSDNAANLAAQALVRLKSRYEGTRLGRQELNGEILDDNPNALWRRDDIENNRVAKAPDLEQIVVAIDVAATSKEESDETGIIVVGLAGEEYYTLADRSMRGTPHQWATAAVSAYHEFRADRIVYESNQGGEMIAHTIENVERGLPLKSVYASRGKHTRAEPIAAIYEQGRAHHVGFFPKLEDQMCEWEPGMDSPDRMDALVWAYTDLNDGWSYVFG